MFLHPLSFDVLIDWLLHVLKETFLSLLVPSVGVKTSQKSLGLNSHILQKVIKLLVEEVFRY